MTEQDTTGDTYTVVLDTEPTANVTVTVGGHAGSDVTVNPTSLTFTSLDWSTAQTVTVTAGNDADLANETVTLTHSAASSDSDYSGVSIAAVTVTVSDNDTAQVTGVMVTPGDAQLVVRWTAVSNATGYRVQWKSGAQGYNTGNRQAVIASGSTTGHTIGSLTNGTEYTLRVTAVRAGANDGPPSAEVTGIPAVPTPAGVSVSESALTVTEQDTTGDTYTVVLDTEPTANVTVTVGGHAGSDVTVNPTSLTFTSLDWSTAQTVTVTAGNDADLANETVTLTHSAASSDSDYSGVSIAAVTVTASDNDTAQVTGVMVTPGDAQLVVRWTAVSNATGYRVQWKSGAQGYNTGNRQAVIASGSTTSHTIGSLTNGTEYTLRVTAVRAGANDGPPSAEVTGIPAVPTPAGVSVSESALTVTEQDTTGDTYTVVLDTEPTANVTVTVGGHAGSDVTVNPTSLTFTSLDWSTAQTVTVTAGNDADLANETVTLTHSAASSDSDYSGVSIAAVTVTVSDNDTAQVTGVMVAPGDAQLVVRWTAVSNATGYRVQWKSGAQGYNTGNRQAVIASGSTTSHTIGSLTNGTEYTLRVTAVRAGANDGPPSAEVTGIPAVPTAAGVSVSESALTVTEQDTTGDTYTVVLDTEPTANVTVTVGGHAGSDVTVNPTSLTFTSLDWSTAQTVTVTAGNDADLANETVTLTHSAASSDSDYSGVSIAAVTVTVSDNDTAQVTGVMVTPGDAQLVVRWTAVSNATGYRVQWKSGAQGYNTGNRQAVIASGSTTSHTIGSLTNGTEYTLRVTAVRAGANDGPPSAEVTGIPAVPTAAGVSVSESALTVTEQDTTGDTYTVVLDTEPTANVTVTVGGHAGSDVTVNPTSLTFTSLDWSTAQTVTVTAGNDADLANETVTLTHSAASSDSDYSGVSIAAVTVTASDNDTAQVTGVMVAPGDAQLVVRWTAVSNATGYRVQWKSGAQGYNTGNRQAVIASGSTTSHTIGSLTNGTEYTLRVTAVRAGANDGPPSAEVTGIPVTVGVPPRPPPPPPPPPPVVEEDEEDEEVDGEDEEVDEEVAPQPEVVVGVEINGPAFAAPHTESVFTVTDTTGLQTLSWTATGPDDFTASSNGEQFALTTPTGGSYTITVTATDPEGDTHTATTTLSVLGDIAGHQFADEIIWLAEQGITRGCSQQPLRYCPQNPVTRAQMATFLTRALNLQTPQQPAGFQDVNPASTHAVSIEALYATQITRGCSQQPLRYCPQNPVTRAQMATFLTRALNLQTPQQPAGFQDVYPASTHAVSIEALYATQITLGCSQQPLRYCPQNPVTRAQMAAFLYRARHLIAATNPN